MCFSKFKELSLLVGKAPEEKFEYFDLFNLKFNDASVNLYVSRKRATKATHIHCTESGDIIWEQLYLFGGLSRPVREKRYVLKPVCDKDAVTVVAIKGKPGNMIGLDEKIKSRKTFPETNKVFLMSSMYVVPFLKLISD